MTDPILALNNICQDLLTQKLDPFISFGINVSLSLATIRLCIFGIGTALNAIDGRVGFNWGGFVRHVLVISIALTMIRSYNQPPGAFTNKAGGQETISETFPGLIMAGPLYLAHTIGDDSWKQLDDAFQKYRYQNADGGMTLDVGKSLWKFCIEALIFIIEAVMLVVMAYGLVASSICALVGPIFIPFLLFDPLSFLFWGWFKAFLQYSFYPVIGAAYTHLFATLLITTVTTSLGPGQTFMAAIGAIPLFILAIIGMLHAPKLCAAIFSGGGGDPDIAGSATKLVGK